eukprot:scaffold462_cov195-Pinguiococcus_pyrenoidosus.AAC.83
MEFPFGFRYRRELCMKRRPVGRQVSCESVAGGLRRDEFGFVRRLSSRDSSGADGRRRLSIGGDSRVSGDCGSAGQPVAVSARSDARMGFRGARSAAERPTRDRAAWRLGRGAAEGAACGATRSVWRPASRATSSASTWARDADSCAERSLRQTPRGEVPGQAGNGPLARGGDSTAHRGAGNWRGGACSGGSSGGCGGSCSGSSSGCSGSSSNKSSSKSSNTSSNKSSSKQQQQNEQE